MHISDTCQSMMFFTAFQFLPPHDIDYDPNIVIVIRTILSAEYAL
jgi:hypothetical protein